MTAFAYPETLPTLWLAGVGSERFELRWTSNTDLDGEPVVARCEAVALLRSYGDALVRQPEFAEFARRAGLPRRADRAIAEVIEELRRDETARFVLCRRPSPRPKLVLDPIDDSHWLSDLSEPEPLAPTEPEPEPEPEPTTWFEVVVVDELGEPVPGIALSFEADGTREATTDDAGVARVDGATVSFGSAKVADLPALRDALSSRWSSARGQDWVETEGRADLTLAECTGAPQSVAVVSETPHTLMYVPRVARARIVGSAFDTNKTFLLPDALAHMRHVVDRYQQHPQSELLIAGHTDTSGDPSYNDPLSLRRAQTVAAYLQDDVDAWLAWYDSSVSSSQRWGSTEDHLMLDTVLLWRGQPDKGTPVATYQQLAGLVVDGDLGPNTRRQLVTDYMGLDGTTLPDGITPVPHGCGENFPLADDGETLDIAALDGDEDPTDRRVELFFFDAPFGVLPPAPGDNSPPSGPEYLEWRLRSRHTQDMVVTRSHTVAVRVTHERTGAVIEGATVSLSPADALGADASTAAGRSTDEFGVSVFLNVVAASYTVRVEKNGYTLYSAQHTVVADAPPSVLPVQLAPDTTLLLALGLLDPEGGRVPLPADTTVVATIDGAELPPASTDEHGRASLPVDVDEGTLKLRLDLADAHYLVVPAGLGGAPRWVTATQATAAARDGDRFVRVPSDLSLTSPAATVDARVDRTADELDLASALAEGEPEAPITVDVSPRWQHLRFAFYDRFAGRSASVPGPTAPDQPAPELFGYDTASTDASLPSEVAHCMWPVAQGDDHVHCLAWFSTEQRPLPDAASMTRMTTPARTFVASAHAGEPLALVQVGSGGVTAKQVDEPSATRLRYYDLPQDWRSAGYWARAGGTLGAKKRRFDAVVEQPTTSAQPLEVSLDDIILARLDDAGRAVPVPVDPDIPYSILDHALRVYEADRRAPYGEPYFTNLAALRSHDDPERPDSVILDYPSFTRAVVYEQIHDVFDRRSTPDDPDIGPIGARLALSPFTSESTKDEVPSHSPCFFQTYNYGEQHPQMRRAGLADPLTLHDIGRSSIAVFRCCGHEQHSIERFAVLRRLRVRFDFSPKRSPPAGAKAIGDGDFPLPTPAQQARLAAQALTTAMHRWNGTDDKDDAPVIHPRDPDAAALEPPDLSTRPVTLEIGEPVIARGTHVCLFQRGSEHYEDSNLRVRLYEGVRAAVGRTGDATWAPEDLAATVSPTTGPHGTPSHTTAHEIGHMLGNNDEYVERSKHASMGAASICDDGLSPGAPYSIDAPNRIAIGSMMKSNHEPRARHFWPAALWLMHEAAAFAPQPATVVRGPLRYQLPVTEQKDSPTNIPIAMTPALEGSEIGRRGLCDVFMYRLGRDRLATEVLPSSGEAPYDAIIVARLKLALSFDGFTRAQIREFVKDAEEKIARMYTWVVGAEVDCELQGEPLRARIVVSPRIIVTSLPSIPTSDSQHRALERDLSKLSYRAHKKPDVEITAPQDRDQAQLDLADLPQRKKEAIENKAKAEQKLATRQAELDAADQKVAEAQKAVDEGTLPPAEAKAQLSEANSKRFVALVALDNAERQMKTAQAEYDKWTDPDIAKKLTRQITDYWEILEQQYSDFVELMIEDQHVHARIEISRAGPTRITDRKSMPRLAKARIRPNKTIDEDAFVTLAGRLLGLKTPSFLPPAFEYRPLCEQLRVPKGTLKFGKFRRPQ